MNILDYLKRISGVRSPSVVIALCALFCLCAVPKIVSAQGGAAEKAIELLLQECRLGFRRSGAQRIGVTRLGEMLQEVAGSGAFRQLLRDTADTSDGMFLQRVAAWDTTKGVVLGLLALLQEHPRLRYSEAYHKFVLEVGFLLPPKLFESLPEPSLSEETLVSMEAMPEEILVRDGVEDLTNEEPPLRVEAIRRAVSAQRWSVLERLAEIAQRDPLLEVRSESMKALLSFSLLEHSQSLVAVNQLIALLRHRGVPLSLRVMIAHELRHCVEHPRIVRPLISLLSDPNPKMRHEAYCTLQEIFDKSAGYPRTLKLAMKEALERYARSSR